MRIDKVEAIPIEVPLRKVFSGSGYRVDSRCTVVTRIRTADGLASEVYNGDNRAHGAAIARIVEDELAPLLIGEDASKIERLWAKMFPLAHPNRDRKLVMEAIACVDTALWDLFGKSLGANVATLLGGFRDRLPIIAIAGYYEEGKTPADLGREMEWLRGAGMAGCKVKVGGLSAEADAERVAACRAGAGPGFILAVDANRGWPTSEAIKFARLIERYEIRWFEEPCHWYDEAAGMAEVRRRTTIPINAGQSEISVARRAPADRGGCGRSDQFRRLGSRRHHRMASGGGVVRGPRDRDGASRGAADLDPDAGRGAARHLCRMLSRSGARSVMGRNDPQPRADQGRDHRGAARAGLWPRARLGSDRPIPSRPVIRQSSPAFAQLV